jgi:anti-sigma factor RsiW
MECGTFDSRIQSYLDGELVALERTLVEGHARGCAPCDGLLGEYRALFVVLEDLEREAAPADFQAAVLGAIAAGGGFPPSPRPGAASPGTAQMGVAMAILLGLLSGGASRLAALGEHLRQPLGEAATWAYAWANGVTFQRSAQYVVAGRGSLRPLLGSLANAACVVLEQRGAVLGATWIAATLTGLALVLWRARGARGDRNVRLHLV